MASGFFERAATAGAASVTSDVFKNALALRQNEQAEVELQMKQQEAAVVEMERQKKEIEDNKPIDIKNTAFFNAATPDMQEKIKLHAMAFGANKDGVMPNGSFKTFQSQMSPQLAIQVSSSGWQDAVQRNRQIGGRINQILRDTSGYAFTKEGKEELAALNESHRATKMEADKFADVVARMGGFGYETEALQATPKRETSTLGAGERLVDVETGGEIARGFDKPEEGPKLKEVKVEKTVVDGKDMYRTDLYFEDGTHKLGPSFQRPEDAQDVASGRMAPTMMKEAIDLYDLKHRVQVIKSQWSKDKTGLLDAATGRLYEKTGTGSKLTSEFYRNTEDFNDKLLRARSGAAISVKELESLQKFSLQPGMSDTKFQANLESLEKYLDDALFNFNGTVTQMGFNPVKDPFTGTFPSPGNVIKGQQPSNDLDASFDELPPNEKQKVLNALQGGR